MTAARAAVGTLPATVRKGKPWVRSFATVHADMQKAPP
jgi:septal ring-binding cell division protein DamX